MLGRFFLGGREKNVEGVLVELRDIYKYDELLRLREDIILGGRGG